MALCDWLPETGGVPCRRAGLTLSRPSFCLPSAVCTTTMHGILLSSFLRLLQHDPHVFLDPIWRRRCPGWQHPLAYQDSSWDSAVTHRQARQWLEDLASTSLDGDSGEYAAWSRWSTLWQRKFRLDNIIEAALAQWLAQEYSPRQGLTLSCAVYHNVFAGPDVSKVRQRFVRAAVKSHWKRLHIRRGKLKATDGMPSLAHIFPTPNSHAMQPVQTPSSQRALSAGIALPRLVVPQRARKPRSTPPPRSNLPASSTPGPGWESPSRMPNTPGLAATASRPATSLLPARSIPAFARPTVMPVTPPSQTWLQERPARPADAPSASLPYGSTARALGSPEPPAPRQRRAPASRQDPARPKARRPMRAGAEPTIGDNTAGVRKKRARRAVAASQGIPPDAPAVEARHTAAARLAAAIALDRRGVIPPRQTEWHTGVDHLQRCTPDELWSMLGLPNNGIPGVHPNIILHWHQVVAVVHLLDNYMAGRPTLLWDDVGLGKTFTILALYAMISANRRSKAKCGRFLGAFGKWPRFLTLLN
jgi:hypothetical protein